MTEGEPGRRKNQGYIRRRAGGEAEHARRRIREQLAHCRKQGTGVKELEAGSESFKVQLSVAYSGATFDVILIFHFTARLLAQAATGDPEVTLGVGFYEDEDQEVYYPDVIPLWDDASAYEVCSLERLLPVLQQWSVLDPLALEVLLRELRGAYTDLQLAKIAQLPDGTERFNLELLSHTVGVELLSRVSMSGHEAHVLVPLWGEGDEGAIGSSGGVKVHMVFRWLGGELSGMGGDSQTPEVRVLVPVDELPVTHRLSSSPKLPSLQAGADVSDWLERVRAFLSAPWAMRRDLVRVLGATYGLLECDVLDYSHVVLLTRVKRGSAFYTFMLQLQLAHDFPTSPPTMQFWDVASSKGASQPVVLDKSRYRYSPRWDVKRMAQELYDHAIACILQHLAAAQAAAQNPWHAHGPPAMT